MRYDTTRGKNWATKQLLSREKNGSATAWNKCSPMTPGWISYSHRSKAKNRQKISKPATVTTSSEATTETAESEDTRTGFGKQADLNKDIG